jgi:hypothetical protein
MVGLDGPAEDFRREFVFLRLGKSLERPQKFLDR